jgi:hypothetical protein
VYSRPGREANNYSVNDPHPKQEKCDLSPQFSSIHLAISSICCRCFATPGKAMRPHYRHAERFFGHGLHRTERRERYGSRSGPLALDDSEIVYIGILPTPLHDVGSRKRELLMLRLNVTEVAAR